MILNFRPVIYLKNEVGQLKIFKKKFQDNILLILNFRPVIYTMFEKWSQLKVLNILISEKFVTKTYFERFSRYLISVILNFRPAIFIIFEKWN